MPASDDIRLDISLLQAGPETAHILFMDMVGYSRLKSDDQRAAQDDLRLAVQATEEYRKALAFGELICHPSGDGMALLFLGGALAAVRCAIQITDALRGHGHIRLRMGLHSGLVLGVQDINAHPDIAGEGIVIAQRVMDLGDAGHILMSDAYRQALDTHEDYRYPMGHLFVTDLGRCTVKHGQAVRVLSLRDKQFGELKFGNAYIPQKLRGAEPVIPLDLKPPPPPLLTSLINALKIAVAGLLLIGLLLGVGRLILPEGFSPKAIASFWDVPAPPPAPAATTSVAVTRDGYGPASASAPVTIATSSRVAQVRVPSFLKMRWSQAVERAGNDGLTLVAHDDNGEIIPLPNDDDKVSKQFPSKGTMLRRWNKVYVSVHTPTPDGPPEDRFPASQDAPNDPDSPQSLTPPPDASPVAQAGVQGTPTQEDYMKSDDRPMPSPPSPGLGRSVADGAQKMPQGTR